MLRRALHAACLTLLCCLAAHAQGPKPDGREAVAYVEESKVVVILVLHARTSKDFDDALPAFRQLVSSYRFLSDKVVTENR